VDVDGLTDGWKGLRGQKGGRRIDSQRERFNQTTSQRHYFLTRSQSVYRVFRDEYLQQDILCSWFEVALDLASGPRYVFVLII
jgi:hypothetical protein